MVFGKGEENQADTRKSTPFTIWFPRFEKKNWN
jgi:hypothetical protein